MGSSMNMMCGWLHVGQTIVMGFPWPWFAAVGLHVLQTILDQCLLCYNDRKNKTTTQCWANVGVDAGPALIQHWLNVLDEMHYE